MRKNHLDVTHPVEDEFDHSYARSQCLVAQRLETARVATSCCGQAVTGTGTRAGTMRTLPWLGLLLAVVCTFIVFEDLVTHQPPSTEAEIVIDTTPTQFEGRWCAAMDELLAVDGLMNSIDEVNDLAVKVCGPM